MEQRGTLTRHVDLVEPTLLAALAVLMAFCSSYAWANETSGVVEIRTIGIPPYGFERGAEDGSRVSSGVYYDIANRIAELAGYQTNNLVYPYARIINELKSGQTDLTIMFKYPFLEEHVVYVAPLAPLKTVVLGFQSSNLNTLENLSGKTLAYLRGAQFSNAIDNDSTIRKLVTDDFDQAARMLVFGRVDGLIGPLQPLMQALVSAKAGELLGEPLVVSERTPWVQISKHSENRLSAKHLRQIFQQMETNGEVEDIIRSYQ